MNNTPHNITRPPSLHILRSFLFIPYQKQNKNNKKEKCCYVNRPCSLLRVNSMLSSIRSGPPMPLVGTDSYFDPRLCLDSLMSPSRPPNRRASNTRYTTYNKKMNKKEPTPPYALLLACSRSSIPPI
jgi:hypothetical protein